MPKLPEPPSASIFVPEEPFVLTNEPLSYIRGNVGVDHAKRSVQPLTTVGGAINAPDLQVKLDFEVGGDREDDLKSSVAPQPEDRPEPEPEPSSAPVTDVPAIGETPSRKTRLKKPIVLESPLDRLTSVCREVWHALNEAEPAPKGRNAQTVKRGTASAKNPRCDMYPSGSRNCEIRLANTNVSCRKISRRWQRINSCTRVQEKGTARNRPYTGLRLSTRSGRR